MAIILAIKTLGKSKILLLNSSPIDGIGITADAGTFAIAENGGTFYKFGSNDTDWIYGGTNIKTITGLSLVGDSGDVYPSQSYVAKFITSETLINSTSYIDIVGATVTLSAGTWILYANIVARNTNVAVLVHGAITDNSNTLVAEASQGGASSGNASVNQYVNLNITGVVTPNTTTTYKLRSARGNTTIVGTFTVTDGAGVGTVNNVSDNSDKGTSLIALRIA